MIENWTYLSIDSLVILFPFLFSFHPKFYFFREWKFYIFPNIFVAIIFVIWDIIFTHHNIWWFNDIYTLGVKFFNLPIEEVLFFISIPYACVFSYFVISQYVNWNIPVGLIKISYFTILLVLFIIIIVYPYKYYTLVTFLLLSFTLVYLIIKKDWNFLKQFMLTYSFVMPFFFLSNGTLTGGLFLKEPIVYYHSSHIIGIRVLNIPIEDFFYGMLLLLWNIKGYLFIKEHWNKQKLFII